MNTIQLTTKEFNIPNRRTRLAALTVDFLIVVILTIIAFKLWGVQTENGSYQITGLPALLLFSVIFFYFFIPETIAGKTLGKHLAGIKVISQDGDSASPKQIFLRHLVDIVEWLPGFFIVYLIVISSNKHRLRIGDMVAKTIVIQEN
jgi:uncharacterized RDD family membrane protein YckC